MRLCQVETRLRQLEGKFLSAESAMPRGKPDAQKYDPERQGASAAMLTATKAYNPAADVVADGKVKKSKVPQPSYS